MPAVPLPVHSLRCALLYLAPLVCVSFKTAVSQSSCISRKEIASLERAAAHDPQGDRTHDKSEVKSTATVQGMSIVSESDPILAGTDRIGLCQDRTATTRL